MDLPWTFWRTKVNRTFERVRFGRNKTVHGRVLGLTVIVRWERRVWRSGRFGFDSGTVTKFTGDDLIVPHIGWNVNDVKRESYLLDLQNDDPSASVSERVYFVHSYRALPNEKNKDWVLSTCDYGERTVHFSRAERKRHGDAVSPRKVWLYRFKDFRSVPVRW